MLGELLKAQRGGAAGEAWTRPHALRAAPARAALRPHAPTHAGRRRGRRPPLDLLHRRRLPPPAGILDAFRAASSAEEPEDGDSDDDADACPVDCVAEVATPSDLDAALAGAGPATLVVVDFYKTSCGACRYIAPGFVKLCKAAGKAGEEDGRPDVVFLKHNVLDDEDGRTELAVREGVRAVPTFHFYRGRERVEAFPTRDKATIAAAVNRLVGREVL